MKAILIGVLVVVLAEVIVLIAFNLLQRYNSRL